MISIERMVLETETAPGIGAPDSTKVPSKDPSSGAEALIGE
jgi:hypothetical protein